MKVAKKSKRWRKELNQLRGMADVPWPARRFKYPPTTGKPLLTDRRCMNPLGEARRRRKGWRGVLDAILFRRPVRQLVLCGAPLELVPFDGRRRGRLVCPRCSPIGKVMRGFAKRQRRAIARGVRGR